MSPRDYGREALASAGLRPPPRLVEPDEPIDATTPANDDWQPPAREPDGPGPDDELIVADIVAPASATVLRFHNTADRGGQRAPERKWLVPARIPLGKVTLLTGDGAAGKTTIAMQLAAATVRAESWLNAVIDHPGPAMVISAEEDDDELDRRVDAIADHQGLDHEAYDGLHTLGLTEGEALLGAPDRAGVIRATPLFEALLAAATRIGPALIVIEAAANVFAGNENDRGQVNQFIGILRRLTTIHSTPAVVLIAHPSLTGIASGSGTSGSTGWSNSVRSRLYFTKASKRDDDKDAPDDVRELRVMKANYGPSGEVVSVRWQRGVFVPEGSVGTLQRVAAEADADATYLACLDAAGAQGRDAYPHPGRDYAPKLFADMPQSNRIGQRALVLAQERLFASGRIHAVPFGPPSKGKKRVERKQLPNMAEAAE